MEISVIARCRRSRRRAAHRCGGRCRAPATPTATLDLGRVDPAGHDLRAATLQHGIGPRALQPLLERLGRWARKYTPHGRVAALEQRLLLAGTPRGWTTERVLAAKILLGGAGAVLGILQLTGSPSLKMVVVAAGLTLFGFFGPDLVLKHKAEERQQVDPAVARRHGRPDGHLGARRPRPRRRHRPRGPHDRRPAGRRARPRRAGHARRRPAQRGAGGAGRPGPRARAAPDGQRPRPGREARRAGRPDPADPGLRAAPQAAPARRGAGDEAPRQDPVPDGDLHPAVPVHRRARTRRRSTS